MKNSTAKKIKQIPKGYLIVGIDPHKKKHVAVAIKQDATVQGKFKVNNSKDGGEKLLERSRVEMEKSNCRGIIFAIEAGGHYWRNLAHMLNIHGVPFRLVSQFTLKRRREGKDHNRLKNDYRDAEMAAELLRTGDFNETQLPKGVYAHLRSSYEAYCRLIGEKTRTINRIKSLLDGVFPEFTHVFKDVSGKTSLGVLGCCPPPYKIAEMKPEEWVDWVRRRQPGKRLMVKKINALHGIAQESFGIIEGAESVLFEISLLAQRLEIYNEQIEKMQKILKELVESIDSSKYLLTITGISHLSIAGILSEVGPLERYDNGKQLVKMAGSNPTQSDSGGKRGSRTPMSKKGRSRLRHCMWRAAIVLLRHNTEFQVWAKERQERPAQNHPLKKREVIVAVGNRLLRLAYALVRDREYYHMPEVMVPVS